MRCRIAFAQHAAPRPLPESHAPFSAIEFSIEIVPEHSLGYASGNNGMPPRTLQASNTLQGTG
eukprot:2878610-Alexandrium_andersonii.AAC.1